MAMTANAGRQPSANEEPMIGSLLGVEGKVVTHFIQSSNNVGVVAGTRRKTWCRAVGSSVTDSPRGISRT